MIEIRDRVAYLWWQGGSIDYRSTYRTEHVLLHQMALNGFLTYFRVGTVLRRNLYSAEFREKRANCFSDFKTIVMLAMTIFSSKYTQVHKAWQWFKRLHPSIHHVFPSYRYQWLNSRWTFLLSFVDAFPHSSSYSKCAEGSWRRLLDRVGRMWGISSIDFNRNEGALTRMIFDLYLKWSLFAEIRWWNRRGISDWHRISAHSIGEGNCR